MHDIGRTQLEAGAFEASDGTGEITEFGEYGEYGEFGEYGEYGELTAESSGVFAETESPFTEAQEIELASELLEVSSEEELEEFLGGLLGTVGRAVGRFVRSDTGRALGGILKSAARQALPIAGRAVGQSIAPGRGGDVGASLASQAGRLLGLELEGLSPEDREFEVARQFVRFAGTAARQACLAPPSASPRQAAGAAAAKAARVHAPGLLPKLAGSVWSAPTTMPQSGRWLRRGRRIVIYLA